MSSDKMKVLITGVSGLLGSNIAWHLKDKFEVLGLYYSHAVDMEGIETKKVDICQKDDLTNIVGNFNPQVLIHCAALAHVETCQTNQELAKEINILGTRSVAKAIAAGDNTKLIHISTDLIYDGTKEFCSETDEINPINWYSLTKYEAEKEALKIKDALILRTNIFGWNIHEKESLAEWILNSLKAKKNINGFIDAYFSSIYTFKFAKIMEVIIRNNLKGLYNCGSSDSCSKYEFASKIADRFSLDKGLIKPISVEDFDFKAKRPKNVRLNVDKLQEDLKIKLPTIDQSLEAFYRDYNNGLPEELKKQVRV